MRRLLVTGGAGFIGANFVRYWHDSYPTDRLVVLDAFTYAGNPANLSGLCESRVRVIRGDIRDQALVERILSRERLDTVVHFAAESHVDRSIDGPDAFVATNIIGTHSLLKAARAVWKERSWDMPVRFHHVSTDEVYGSLTAEQPAFTESSPFAPNSPYSASKAGADHLVRAYHRTYELPVTLSHCSNNYGPFQFPEKLVALMITNVLRGEPLPIYGDGGNVRDWLYVVDHCRAIDAILERGRVGESYAIGGRAERTNLDLVRTLCGLIDRRFRQEPELARRFPHAPPAHGRPSVGLLQFVADRPGHDRRYAVNPGKAGAELDFEPLVTFETGMDRTLDWYLSHEAWWGSVLDGSYRDHQRLVRSG